MKSNKPTLIISTCGISLASNVMRQTKDHYPASFSPFRYANAINLAETDAQSELTLLSNNILNRLSKADISEQRRLSAELNALWGFYDNQPNQHPNDLHFLIHTDTWLGENVAKALKAAMEQHSLLVNIQKIDELRTSSLACFRNGTGELIGFLEKMLEGYKDSYHIVFNLSGGFKSIQGVMQSLASIYADEVIYIFEGSDALLHIPRLPMTLDWQEINTYSINLRRLMLGLSVDDNQPILPRVFLYQVDDDVTLSEWGELIAKRSKKELYTKALLPSPSASIRYSKQFERTLSKLDAERMKLINERIDELARYLETGKWNKNLDFKNIKKGEHLGSTHEIDAWSDKDAKRIFCHYDTRKQPIVVLDMLAKALH